MTAISASRLRLAHAAAGTGPLTFVHNKGVPVVLEFGESVDLTVSGGMFYVDVQGVPPEQSWFDFPLTFEARGRDGDDLSVYVAGGVCCGANPQTMAGLVSVWDAHPEVSQDSVRVRLIQGWNSAPVVYVLPGGAPAVGLPTLCYFDPSDHWGYSMRPVGALDFVLAGKAGASSGSVRIPVTVEGGGSSTYVITQQRGQPPSIVAFPDP